MPRLSLIGAGSVSSFGFFVQLLAPLLAGRIRTQGATGGTIGSGSGWTLNGSGTLEWAIVTTPTVSWLNASAQCTALGSGWRLPTQGELSALYNTSAAISAATAAGWTLGRTWSSSLTGSNYYNVYLNTGGVVGINPVGSVSYASCVRSL